MYFCVLKCLLQSGLKPVLVAINDPMDPRIRPKESAAAAGAASIVDDSLLGFGDVHP